MVVENEVLPYFQWLWRGDGASVADGQGALVLFAIIVVVIGVLALVGGFVVSLVRHGPVKAGEITYRTLVGGLGDLTRLSPRRIGALAGLAVKEALRRRVLVALVVFGLILLFASWYLGTNNREPARLYVSFVTTATSYLMLLLALVLAAFSLPSDIKNKTIYTVATKPVRAGDIVLGRMLGFTAIGTVLLAVMAIGSWFFVNGSLAHTHTVDALSLKSVKDYAGETIGQEGVTSTDGYHSHTLTLDNEGYGLADTAHGHTHEVVDIGGEKTVGPAQDYLRARVPKLGKITFYNQQGVKVSRGISVGNEWAYRSFIQGASQAAAVWEFSGVSESTLMEYDDGSKYLPLNLIVRVYRSYKGVIEQSIQGSIQLRNPDNPDITTTLKVFPAEDNVIDSFEFANEQTDTEQRDITILDDLVSEDGRIEVIVQCLDRGMYFGFAQADCFLRLPEGSPLWNFVKGYLSIWMQMVIVIAVAVTMSTFLNGPIAMIASVSFIVLGFFRAFFLKIALGENYGGGPIESFVRMVTQMNMMSPFEETPVVVAMQAIDGVLKTGMRAVSYILPDFSQYLDRVRYVAEGFSVPADAVARDLTVCLAYVVGLAIAGYFCLRTREVAK